MLKKRVLGLLLLTACSSTPHSPQPTPQARVRTVPVALAIPVPVELRGQDKRPQEALQAFTYSCPRLSVQWQSLCRQARLTQMTPQAARQFFQHNFDSYTFDSGSGLLTGYMEAQLKCNWQRTPTYSYPVHGVPADLRKGVPYLTRRQIETTPTPALRRAELLYCDKFDAFVLGVQGSGRVVMPDGQVVKLTYASKNNRAYTSIGRVLIDAGEVSREQMSMQAIKHWVQRNPQRIDWLLQQNESYVFYQIDTRADQPVGPPGAMALKDGLMPFRSVAVDPQHIPMGTPLFIRSQWPDQSPFSRIVIAQDKGGAIKGRIRADLFLGHGDLADELAGRLQSPLDLHVLWPKGWPVPNPEWVPSPFTS
ncbi:murein transglycosylase A [Pseudaeromonas sharmana]|uniref:Membrane-bound lytic murein transglycosylase A n=1 Tax=Pseudaeromonas sharmana TaxID=328412 RepID=A0ABV8CRC0_9GAMM